MNSLLWLLDLVIRAYRDRFRRREWAAGRPARLFAEIARSDRHIAETFPSDSRNPSPAPSDEKEIP